MRAKASALHMGLLLLRDLLRARFPEEAESWCWFLRMWFYKLKRLVSSFFYPPRCPYCRDLLAPGGILCAQCQEIFKVQPQVSMIELDYSKKVCAVSAFLYEGKVRDAICDFKFRENVDYVDHFAMSVVSAIRKSGFRTEFDIITCVPMSQKNKKSRGFNQSEVLAKTVSKLVGATYRETIKKIKVNKTQHSLNREERILNVKGAYGILDKNYVKNRDILLCDDILTTGSTLKECALKLSDAGAKSILCATIAKTP